MAEVKTKETIPFWLAVGITAIVFLPLTIFLGKYNIPLWVSFIVWAEFFNFGATVKKAWKFILIAFPAGAAICAAGFIASFSLSASIPALAGPGGSGMWGMWVGFGIAVCVLVYIMKFSKILSEGSLSYFNGMTMMIAVLFTNSYPKGDNLSIQINVIIACLWTILSGCFGLFLGWFNMAITFPKEVHDSK
ncbi:MAG TPA: DUF1097 family protein [Rectinema sp.]|jgi:hypothetical protein|nr:DUF1097 family protein [Rectinema sp.]